MTGLAHIAQRAGRAWSARPSRAHGPGLALAPQGLTRTTRKGRVPTQIPQPEQAIPLQWEALGRSHGGLSTKPYLAADSLGQRHDSVAFELTLAQVAVVRTRTGRPRTRPDALLADKAYSSRAVRAHLSRRNIKAVIAIKEDQHVARLRKGAQGERPPSFDKVHYRKRNAVERAVNTFRAYRAVGTRCDKRDYIYRGTTTLATILIWLRDAVTRP